MDIYIIPLAEKGFISTGEHNKVRYYLADEAGNLAACGPFDTVEAAAFHVRKNGWNLPDEP